MIYLIYFQTFRVRTSSRLAAMKIPPEKAETKNAGRKSHLVSRIKQLPAVPNVMLNTKRKITSNIGRKTKAAMHMREKRYICNIEKILAPNKTERGPVMSINNNMKK